MLDPDQIAISFLAAKVQDFVFTIYRKKIEAGQQSVPNTRFLPADCIAASSSDDTNTRYAVSLISQEGYEEVQIRAWVNPELTQDVLHQALLSRATATDLSDNTELPDKTFYRKIGFVLHRHREYGDVREVMWLRPFDLRVHGKFGFLCSFALRVPNASDLPAKRRLELSLTHKNGRINEDFFLDQHQKIADFLRTYFDAIQRLKLHDGSEIELESKLSVIPSFTLSTRTYVFGGNRQGKNQFFGLRDYAPFQTADPFLFLVYQLRRLSLEAKLILVIGYGFGDEHINGILQQALRGEQEMRLVAVTWFGDNLKVAEREKKEAQFKSFVAKQLGLEGDREQRLVLQVHSAKSFLGEALSLASMTNHFPVEESIFAEIESTPTTT